MTLQKKLNKKVLLILLPLILLLGFTSVLIVKKSFYTSDDSNPKVGKRYFQKGYSDSAFFYSCSKEIEVIYQGSFLDMGSVYVPVNKEEADKYCRSSGAIEYRAVIDILARKDVDLLVSKYNSAEVWVRALGHTYIHDKEYLKRILPAYSDIKIDCIIVVHSPEGTRFFIENGEAHKSHDDHQYIEVSEREFLTSLNNAPNTDVNNFWLGLH